MKQTAGLMMLVAAALTADLGAAKAEAATITWYWAGPVDGYIGDTFGGPSLASAVPLGTMVKVSVSFDPEGPILNPIIPCLQGYASTSLRVVGRTYTNVGYVWVEGEGFGPGTCTPGVHWVEIVVPGWGGPEALPGGWESYSPGFYPGFWWSGDLTTQPTSIRPQFPTFSRPDSSLQSFTANLNATGPVPEPSTWLLFATGLSVAVWRRRRHH